MFKYAVGLLMQIAYAMQPGGRRSLYCYPYVMEGMWFRTSIMSYYHTYKITGSSFFSFPMKSICNFKISSHFTYFCLHSISFFYLRKQISTVLLYLYVFYVIRGLFDCFVILRRGSFDALPRCYKEGRRAKNVNFCVKRKRSFF